MVKTRGDPTNRLDAAVVRHKTPGATPMIQTARAVAGLQRRRGEDRQNTRAQLLEAAGHLFAQKGFDRATGKEICERAGTNSAAINYYFGGMDGLYAAVLEEANIKLSSVITDILGMSGRRILQAIVAGETDPMKLTEHRSLDPDHCLPHAG